MLPRNRIYLAALLHCTVALTAVAEFSVGDPLPSLEKYGLSGMEIPTTKNKVVVLDFWASWCAPCKASFPIFSTLNQEYSDRGLVIIAVGVDDKTEAYTAFVSKLQPSFITVHDQGHQLVSEAKVPAMPTSYLFGRDGRLRFIHRGFHGDSTAKQFRQQIESLLNEIE